MEIETEDFIKGLRLLHSRSQESSDELKKLLDIYQARKLNFKSDSRKPKESVMNAFSAIQSLNQCLRGDDKKMKIEDDSETTDIEDNELLDSNDSSSSTAANLCVVCKQNLETNNNRLLECNECHHCYHIDCHKPMITKKELNDPRSIWYCFKCKNNGRKLNKNQLGHGKVIIDPNKVVHSVSKSMMDTIKQRSNKISTTQSTPFHPIIKASSAASIIGAAIPSTSTTAPLTSTGNQAVGRQQAMSINNSIANKTKAVTMHQTSYTTTTTVNSISMDKRLANMKKVKSNSSKFS